VEQNNQSQTLFILLGGLVFTAITLAIMFILPYLQINNWVINYLILFVFEFGLYCLTLYLYLSLVTKVLWFNQGVSILIFITIIKIVVSALLIFILFSLSNRFLKPGFGNIIDLLGPFVRGFIIELALIGIASKIFETDIFDKKGDENDRIIDDLK
jgi:hypothetical protein